jgi:hypothetical protein
VASDRVCSAGHTAAPVPTGVALHGAGGDARIAKPLSMDSAAGVEAVVRSMDTTCSVALITLAAAVASPCQNARRSHAHRAIMVFVGEGTERVTVVTAEGAGGVWWKSMSESSRRRRRCRGPGGRRQWLQGVDVGDGKWQHGQPGTTSLKSRSPSTTPRLMSQSQMIRLVADSCPIIVLEHHRAR